MASIAQCKNNINSYGIMKDNIKAIIIYLNKSVDINANLLSKIDSLYEVDNNGSIIYDKVKELSNDVTKTSNYLNNTILPAIDIAIKKEYNTIADIESQQEQEKAQAAASSSSSSSSSSSGSTKPAPKDKNNRTALLE